MASWLDNDKPLLKYSNIVVGGRRPGTREKGGGVYEKRKKRGLAGFPRCPEEGEIGEIMQHCVIFCDRKSAKTWKRVTDARIEGYGKAECLVRVLISRMWNRALFS